MQEMLEILEMLEMLEMLEKQEMQEMWGRGKENENRIFLLLRSVKGLLEETTNVMKEREISVIMNVLKKKNVITRENGH